MLTPPSLTTVETLPTLRSETMAAYGHLPTLHFDSRDIKDVDDQSSARHLCSLLHARVLADSSSHLSFLAPSTHLALQHSVPVSFFEILSIRISFR